jgi:hypothetical protein
LTFLLFYFFTFLTFVKVLFPFFLSGNQRRRNNNNLIVIIISSSNLFGLFELGITEQTDLSSQLFRVLSSAPPRLAWPRDPKQEPTNRQSTTLPHEPPTRASPENS